MLNTISISEETILLYTKDMHAVTEFLLSKFTPMIKYHLLAKYTKPKLRKIFTDSECIQSFQLVKPLQYKSPRFGLSTLWIFR